MEVEDDASGKLVYKITKNWVKTNFVKSLLRIWADRLYFRLFRDNQHLELVSMVEKRERIQQWVMDQWGRAGPPASLLVVVNERPWKKISGCLSICEASIELTIYHFQVIRNLMQFANKY